MHYFPSIASNTDLMDQPKPYEDPPRSHLFTVRLWREEIGSGESEMRMQVKHVLSGETRYFREWSDLVEYLQRTLQIPE